MRVEIHFKNGPTKFFVFDDWVISEGQFIGKTVINGTALKTIVAPGEWEFIMEHPK